MWRKLLGILTLFSFLPYFSICQNKLRENGWYHILSADYIFSEIIRIQFKGDEILRRYDRLSGNAVRLSGQDMIPAIFPKLVLANRKIR